MSNLLLKARAGRADALAKRSTAAGYKFSSQSSELTKEKLRRNAPIPFISKRAQNQTPSWVH